MVYVARPFRAASCVPASLCLAEAPGDSSILGNVAGGDIVYRLMRGNDVNARCKRVRKFQEERNA
jgi:hypothetical protein